MAITSEVLIAANAGSGSVTTALAPDAGLALHAHCLWCGRRFSSRTTGGSIQKFCCTEHRQQFWIAARRWTMRAIEALLEGISRERARCLRGIPIAEVTVHSWRSLAAAAMTVRSIPESDNAIRRDFIARFLNILHYLLRRGTVEKIGQGRGVGWKLAEREPTLNL